MLVVFGVQEFVFDVFFIEKGRDHFVFAMGNQETLDLLQRAQPLPTPPSDIGGTQFAFSVPILFELK